MGCGEGHVAAELTLRGYRLTGVDADPESVVQAQERGVHAVSASWPEFDSPPLDAVVFTRSLHHISPLDQVVDRAGELLRPMGYLLIEDFAFDEANEPTIAWLLKVLRSPQATALIDPTAGGFAADLLGSNNPVEAWHHNHDHDLHTIAQMQRAIAARFAISETHSVPYLYRYLVPMLAKSAEAASFVDQVFREEMRLGAQGKLVLIGRRLVASHFAAKQ